MSNSPINTDWVLNAKGNYWRRLSGKLLMVGLFRDSGYYWALRDGEFLKREFRTEEQAQIASETCIDGDVDEFIDFHDKRWRYV